MAARGASPAHPSAGPAGSSATSQDITQLRNATNFRTVQRNDPALIEILDTSTYSVIYHYDAAGEKWEKQKQEGPLFVVRRSKAPEYALYMLNRQAVKNVTIPLIPGEMKATAIDASMLQVARRGEKIRYGIWFTEGSETVQRFRESIVRVVGEPSKQPATSERASPAPGASASQPNPPANGDGLSRLFAGLTTVPASKGPQSSSNSPQPNQPPQPAQTMSQPQYSQPPPPGPPAQHYTPSVAPFTGNPTPYGQYPPAPSPGSNDVHTPQPPAQPAPPPIQSQPFAPGQTVDDLLKGILGPTAPSGSSLGPPPPVASAPTTTQMPGAVAPRTTPPPSNTSPVRSPPGIVPTQAKRGGQGAVSSPRRGPGPSNGYPSPPKAGPPLPQPQHVQPQQMPPPPIAMRDALVTTFAPDGARPPPVPKEQLVGTLIHLLQTNPAFGDDVWQAYLARCGGPPQ